MAARRFALIGHVHTSSSVTLQLSDLTDVTSAAVTDKFVLVADGSAYVGRALLETDIVDGSLFARVADNETIAGAWTFDANVVIDNGNSLKIWDSTTTDNIEISHNGSHVVFAGTNVSGFQWSGANVFDLLGGITFRVRDSSNSNFVSMAHGGTDFNIVGTNTTDINLTGITALQAGTVDADFDAITATSFGGIASANLLDKAAAETIGGLWNFAQTFYTAATQDKISLFDNRLGSTNMYGFGVESGTLYFKAFDTYRWYNSVNADAGASDTMELTGSALTINVPITATSYGGVTEANLLDKSAAEVITGAYTFDADLTIDNGNKLIVWDSTTTDKMEIFHDGTDFQFSATNVQDIEIQNITGDFKIRDGAGLSLFDATDADKVTFNHDGTDFNLVGFQTTDWNISGFTAIKAGTVDADFDVITATSYGGITEANLLDKSATEAIGGSWTFNAQTNFSVNPRVNNNISFMALNAASSANRFLIKLDILDRVIVGDSRESMHLEGAAINIRTGYLQPATATDTALNDITNAINTAAGKIQGAMIYNTTTDNPVYAVGNTDGAVWVDGAGTTVNTPV